MHLFEMTFRFIADLKNCVTDISKYKSNLFSPHAAHAAAHATTFKHP
jgi:hypothetical protein